VRPTTDEWAHYYETAESRRILEGGDPLKKHLERYILRERILLLGSGLCLAGLVTAFCVVLLR
jgi:hypothetical protein